MLVDRINAVAPQIPAEIRRWFLEADYAMAGVRNQDWDLVLAEWDFVPLLSEYVEDRTSPIEKRYEAFSALMVLRMSMAASDAARKKTLNHEIERLVLADREFSRRVSDECLGLVEALVVRKILGEEIPKDLPNWMHEEIANRA